MIKFIRNDITKVKADVIVDTANPYPVIGGGTDSAIYKAAGEEKLLTERQKIGNIERGDAVITSGFNLSEFIIHTVGPKYIDGSYNEEKLLRSCYRKSLKLAKENQCRSIAFPLISTGVYGFPKEEAVSIAVSEINDFLLKEGKIDVMIVVFDDESYVTCLKVAKEMEQFIDSEDSKAALEEEYSGYYDQVLERQKQIKRAKLTKKTNKKEKDSFIVSDDPKTFSEMIYYYLQFRNEKPSELYSSAKIDRRLWSKILINDYHPNKHTVIKLCFALKLTLPQSVDLLARADYAFNPSKPEEMIIMDCIKKNMTFEATKNKLKETGLTYF